MADSLPAFATSARTAGAILTMLAIVLGVLGAISFFGFAPSPMRVVGLWLWAAACAVLGRLLVGRAPPPANESALSRFAAVLFSACAMFFVLYAGLCSLGSTLVLAL